MILGGALNDYLVRCFSRSYEIEGIVIFSGKRWGFWSAAARVLQSGKVSMFRWN